jgi:rubrerythrin
MKERYFAQRNAKILFLKRRQHNQRQEVKMAGKKFWRCNVCSDIHYGMKGPEICPTCGTKNAYMEIDRKEAKTVTKL